MSDQHDLPAATTISVDVPVRLDFAGAWTDVPAFADVEGGAVLNVAVGPGVRGLLELGPAGLRVSYESGVPPGAGLGASAAMSVAWLSLVTAAMGRPLMGAALAEAAFRLEAVLGITGGRQDQYAAALGGLNLLRFDQRGVTVERPPVAPNVMAELRRRLVLCYSGERRLSGDIHDHVWGAVSRGEAGVVSALRRLRELAAAARDALVAGDLDRFGGIIAQNWACQRALHPSITNARIESLFAAAAAAGAASGKACGAGGGGCILFYCPDPRAAAAAAAALAAAGAAIIDFSFAPPRDR